MDRKNGVIGDFEAFISKLGTVPQNKTITSKKLNHIQGWVNLSSCLSRSRSLTMSPSWEANSLTFISLEGRPMPSSKVGLVGLPTPS